MRVPFAPTYGWARRLATPAWLVTSKGEAIRTGSATGRGHEFLEKENMTARDPVSLIWREGFSVNPDWRKPGCEMVVGTQSGEARPEPLHSAPLRGARARARGPQA